MERVREAQMSDSIKGSIQSGSFSGFKNHESFDEDEKKKINNDNSIIEQSFGDFLVFDNIGNKFKEAFTVTDFSLPPKTEEILKKIKLPRPASDPLKKAARGVLGAFNWLTNWKLAPSSTLKSDEKIAELRDKKCSFKLPELKENSGPYSMSTSQLARLAGLDETKTKIKQFDKSGETDYKKILFGPEGEPHLWDVEQKPALQDCWFLSSITSLLNSQGTTAITRLFSESQKPDHVTVRLGENTYDVPLGRIADDYHEFGSYSKNWVIVLENAMLMHRAVFFTENKNVWEITSKLLEAISMPLKSSADGLNALLGLPLKSQNKCTTQPFGKLGCKDNNEVFNFIEGKIKKNRPCILGTESYFSAAYDGEAKGHALAVLGINEKDKSVIILDPYGHKNVIGFSSLSAYDVVFADI